MTLSDNAGSLTLALLAKQVEFARLGSTWAHRRRRAARLREALTDGSGDSAGVRRRQGEADHLAPQARRRHRTGTHPVAGHSRQGAALPARPARDERHEQDVDVAQSQALSRRTLRAGPSPEGPAHIIERVSDGFALETITTAEGLEALSAEWDDLVRAMPRPSPFLLHGWVVEWWRQFGDRRRAGGRRRPPGRPTRRRRAGLHPACAGRPRVAVPRRPRVGARRPAARRGRSPARPAASCWTSSRRQPFDYADLFGLPAGVGTRPAPAATAARSSASRRRCSTCRTAGRQRTTAKTTSKKRNLHRRRLRQLGELGEVEFVGRAHRATSSSRCSRRRSGCTSCAGEGRPDGSTFGTEDGPALPSRRAARARRRRRPAHRAAAGRRAARQPSTTSSRSTA